MKYLPIDSKLFIENRKRFVSNLKPNSMAIFNANDMMPRNADAQHFWRQNSDLFYLTGIDQEETVLILFPDCPIDNRKEILFIKRTSEEIATWEGHKYTIDEAKEASGIQHIFWLDQMPAILNLLMRHAELVYLNTNENDRYVHEVGYRDLRFINDLRSQYPIHSYQRSAPIMAKLREIKSSTEVELVSQAVEIAKKAFFRMAKKAKPGVWEFELEAEMIHEYLINRATGHAFEPIIASGKNSCILHYNKNNQQLKDGDIILLDFGAEYGMYNSDITRVLPVNGKFTQRQKDVYNAVLNIQKEAKKMLVVGTERQPYEREVGKIATEELIKLGLLNKEDVAKQNPDAPLYKRYFMHGTSHFLGLDVHDIGNYYGNKFAAGMILTCEPGIYIKEEGIGIRLENDILITETGNIDLMEKAGIPIEAEEVEALMK
jgi:Xaa-Pro aminopeptidase